MDSETSTINDVDLLERVLLDGNAEPMLVPFSLLERITNSFSEDHRIGSGGFAVVYKGNVGKVMVAVKKLLTNSLPEDKFNGEVECLIKARHKNVVRFVGYCSDTQKIIAYVDKKLVMAEVRNWLLCFEYVPNGSLDKHITDASGGLEWRERYGIIKGICEGLLQLHKSGILHLDLKPSNILVDDHMVPKIADFGLSKCLDKEQSRAFLTKIYVSPGYFAPEYSNGEAAFTSDIYSLGVIILEILTGKKGYPEDEKVINNWKNRLEGSNHWDVQLEQVRVCMEIGKECINSDPKKRPVAHHIIDRLHGKASNVETSITSSSAEQQVVDNWENRLEGSDHWNTKLEHVRVSMKIGIDCMDLDPMKRPVAHHIIDTIDGKISSIETCIRSSSVEQQLERVLLDGNAEPMYVPLSLLEEITNFFSHDHEIGRGGLAVVYKGIVGKGMIAVKKLSRTFDLPESKFHKEVEWLVKAKHKNIVRFLGYCSETQGRIADYEGMFVMSDIRNYLLCFEYVPNGNLDKYITVASHGLEWRDRFEIIKGICEGLSHLHKMRILHLDLKPSNILIDDRMVPKIADFGLSRFDKDSEFLTSDLCGSLGYLAPEFFRGQVSYAADIYSLGCIIVEILTGEKGYLEDEIVVGNWVNRLEGSEHWDTQLEQVRVCIKIGIACMDADPKKRPDARHITDRLHGKASSIETSISSSSEEQQVSFLEDQARHIMDRLHAEASSVGTSIGISSVKQQDTKHNVIPEDASLSSTNSGLLYKLNNLDIFNTKAHRNYLANGGPILEKFNYVKLFRNVKLKPILKRSNLIRRGSSGDEVYVGFVDRVQVVVRKQIGVSGTREKRQFENEVLIQSQILHKNIVRFIGCCVEVEIPMLVYEFFSKGSLDEILCGHNRLPLDLAVRLSIAAQAACALAYMHSKSFLHGNIRSSNILLNDLFVPKISDSGISRMFGEYYEDTGIMSCDMAYMDPVYLQTGLLTEKSDVYGFGIVILELLTRKSATQSDNNSLNNFLENHKKGRKSTTLFDKEIAVTGDLEILDNLAEVVVECLAFDVDQRPTMKVVAKRLSILNKSYELALLQAS